MRLVKWTDLVHPQLQNRVLTKERLWQWIISLRRTESRQKKKNSAVALRALYNQRKIHKLIDWFSPIWPPSQHECYNSEFPRGWNLFWSSADLCQSRFILETCTLPAKQPLVAILQKAFLEFGALIGELFQKWRLAKQMKHIEGWVTLFLPIYMV